MGHGQGSSKAQSAESNPERAARRYEEEQGRYLERVRRRAERNLRSLIHKEFHRRFSEALRGGCGATRRQRFCLAYERIGIRSDEVRRGVLGLGVLLAINESNATDLMAEAEALVVTDGGDASILSGANRMGLAGQDVAGCVAAAFNAVRQPVSLLRAEREMERTQQAENASSGENDEAWRQAKSVMESVRRRGRRRVGTPSQEDR